MRALLLLLALSLGGCTSFEMAGLRNALDRDYPEADLGPGYSFSFGRFSVGLARMLAGHSDDEGGVLAGLVLREVRRVQVGIYPVRGAFDAASARMPERLRQLVGRNGWEHLASFREDGEAGWIVYREREGEIAELFVVAFGEDELMMARLRGNLSEAVQRLVDSHLFRDEGDDADDGDEFDQAVSSDSTAWTPEALGAATAMLRAE